MDFDPENEKWRCCCCRIPTGLKIMGIAEAICAAGVFAIALHLLNGQAQQPNGGNFFLFYLCLAALAFLFAASSLLMVLGVRKRKVKWLYPTIVIRALLLIFITVFGVSTGVVQHSSTNPLEDELSRPTKAPKRKVKMGGGRKVMNQEEPSTMLRLVFLIVLMLVVSIVVFYTIFLVMRGIHFIQGYNRLKRRRSSFMVVAQLDPNLMAAKRPSQCSFNPQQQQQELQQAQQQPQYFIE